jgi:hypothetical protein
MRDYLRMTICYAQRFIASTASAWCAFDTTPTGENDLARNMALGLRLAIVCVVMALSGCAAVKQAHDGEALKQNQGLLAFYVISNADAVLTFGDYVSESTFGSRFSEEMVGPKGAIHIKAGKTYHLVPIDAGDYMFSKFNVNPRFAWLQATNRFKVAPNSITYIGHIQVYVADKGFKLGAADRELDMRTYLADSYPTYFKSMGLQKSVVQLDLR